MDRRHYGYSEQSPLSKRGAFYAKGSSAGALPLLMRAAHRQGNVAAMGNPYGITLDEANYTKGVAIGEVMRGGGVGDCTAAARLTRSWPRI